MQNGKENKSRSVVLGCNKITFCFNSTLARFNKCKLNNMGQTEDLVTNIQSSRPVWCIQSSCVTPPPKTRNYNRGNHHNLLYSPFKSGKPDIMNFFFLNVKPSCYKPLIKSARQSCSSDWSRILTTYQQQQNYGTKKFMPNTMSTSVTNDSNIKKQLLIKHNDNKVNIQFTRYFLHIYTHFFQYFEKDI